jgi:hypothetical protein
MAQRKPYMGFTAGQQDAEPEWLDVVSRPTNQQGAENGERVGHVARWHHPMILGRCVNVYLK